jgi:WD40 repeat protein
VQEPAEVKEKREAGEVQPQGKETQKVVSKLIWEKTFDEPIEEVIWGEMEVTVEEARKVGIMGLGKKLPGEKIKINCPVKVIMKVEGREGRIKYASPDKAVKYLDLAGNVIKEGALWERGFEPSWARGGEPPFINHFGQLTWRRKEKIGKDKESGADVYKIFERNISYSKDRKYVGVMDITSKEINEYPYDFRSKFTYYKEKRKLWQTKLPDNLVVQCSISDNGDYIFLRVEMEMAKKFVLFIYNKAGKLVFSREDVELLKFSSNGRYAVISDLKRRQYIRGQGETKVLQCVDVETGTVSQNIEFEAGEYVDVWEMGNNGVFIVDYRNQGEVKAYDKRGRKLWRNSESYYTDAYARISQCGKYTWVIALRQLSGGWKEKKILYDNIMGQPVWIKEENDFILVDNRKIYNFGFFGFSPDTKYLCLGGKGIIFFCNLKGEVIWHKEINLPGVRRKAEFSPDGKFLMTTNLWNKIILFQIHKNKGGE